MIKIQDVQYIRLRAPDLDEMETFLSEFGLHRSARTETALYMRGTDAEHTIHITELGEPAFLGMAFNAASEEDLEAISAFEGASEVMDNDEPYGGKKVVLSDPDGLKIEIIHDINQLEEIELKEVVPFNSGSRRRRVGPVVRSYPRPSQVKRLGHIVLRCGEFEACDIFYKEVLGMLVSDKLYRGEEEAPGETAAEFLRCDRGQEYTDHHTILVTNADEAGLGHVAFEVEDWNDLSVGHWHMQETEYKHNFGLGRHILGSQLFDYWSDPWGNNHEHWTDGDLLNEDTPTGAYPLHTARDVQWSPPRNN
jgi:catechol 2,3-dioxygenase-like lactoylglutathione lyase family enzyme